MTEPTAAPDPDLEKRRAAMREACKDMTCDCCRRDKNTHPVLGVASSGVVAMSFAWCHECLREHAEPEIVFIYWRDEVAGVDGIEGLADWALDMKTFAGDEYVAYKDWIATHPREQHRAD